MQTLIPHANPLGEITRIEYHGQPVLTPAQLAEFYETNINNLQVNFRNNAERFIKGKHYFKLEGDDLNEFRHCLKNFQTVVSPRTSVLYLWTKQGCARHCKSVGTDKAWDVFEVLEENYFNPPAVVEKPLPSVSNYKLAIVATRLAAHAEDPYMKRRLVAKAANLLFGEEFAVPDCHPAVQLSLFK